VAEASVIIEPCVTRAQIKRFARVPRLLYTGLAGYAPPLDLMEAQTVDPGFNPYFRHAEAAFWIARRADALVGRISAQVDTLDAAMGREALGHFGCLAAIDDPAVTAALLEAAHGWLRARGVREVTGPFKLSINAESGLLVEGFRERAMFMTSWDPPWLGGLVEAAGYSRAADLHSYDYPQLEKPIAAAKRLLERKGLGDAVTVRLSDMRRIGHETDIVRDLFNDGWRDNWGFVPMTEDEMRHLAKELKPFLFDECISIAEIGGEPAAFAAAVPNLMDLFEGLDGKLLPFGWATVARRWIGRRYRTGRVAMMGVRRRYRDSAMGAGLALIAVEALREAASRHGLQSAELGWVLDSNTAMRRMLEVLGATSYKIHRVYRTSLNA